MSENVNKNEITISKDDINNIMDKYENSEYDIANYHMNQYIQMIAEVEVQSIEYGNRNQRKNFIKNMLKSRSVPIYDNNGEIKYFTTLWKIRVNKKKNYNYWTTTVQKNIKGAEKINRLQKEKLRNPKK